MYEHSQILDLSQLFSNIPHLGMNTNMNSKIVTQSQKPWYGSWEISVTIILIKRTRMAKMSTGVRKYGVAVVQDAGSKYVLIWPLQVIAINTTNALTLIAAQ